jgi:uncharacterized protein YjiK
MRCTRRIALLVAVTATVSCRSDEKIGKAEAAELAAREQRLDTRLAKADASDSDQTPVAMWLMPQALSEISGIALTPDGRLLAHDDEIGKVYEIDPRRGVILKTFLLGKGPHADFEGITVAGSDIYLLASNGVLFRFREGANGSSVPYTMHDTRLGKECAFEGVAFQPDSAWLVLPCKTVHRKKMGGEVVLYRWRIGASRSTGLSMLTIPLDEVIGSNKWKNFRPSDITIDPATGNYVMVSSLDKGLVEMTPAGDVVKAWPLPGTHRQPEGVAITKDGILMISDEGSTRAAAITLYHWSRAEAGDTTR